MPVSTVLLAVAHCIVSSSRQNRNSSLSEVTHLCEHIKTFLCDHKYTYIANVSTRMERHTLMHFCSQYLDSNVVIFFLTPPPSAQL